MIALGGNALVVESEHPLGAGAHAQAAALAVNVIDDDTSHTRFLPLLGTEITLW